MKRQKQTRAYKVGFTDGQRGDYRNPYEEQSPRHADYNRGFRAGGDAC